MVHVVASRAMVSSARQPMRDSSQMSASHDTVDRPMSAYPAYTSGRIRPRSCTAATI